MLLDLRAFLTVDVTVLAEPDAGAAADSPCVDRRANVGAAGATVRRSTVSRLQPATLCVPVRTDDAVCAEAMKVFELDALTRLGEGHVSTTVCGPPPPPQGGVEVIVLCGPSGSGKTTILQALAASLSPGQDAAAAGEAAGEEGAPQPPPPPPAAFVWDPEHAVVAQMGAASPARAVARLQAVGLRRDKWLHPYDILSSGRSTWRASRAPSPRRTLRSAPRHPPRVARAARVACASPSTSSARPSTRRRRTPSPLGWPRSCDPPTRPPLRLRLLLLRRRRWREARAMRALLHCTSASTFSSLSPRCARS